MTIHTLTLTNPGGETGDTSGWTLRSVSGPAIVFLNDGSGNVPHTGSYYFSAGSGATSQWDQEVDVSAYATEIDAGNAAIHATVYHSSLASQGDRGGIYVEARDVSSVLLDSQSETQDHPNPWAFRETYLVLPTGTRFVRVGTKNTRTDGSGINSYWDDFTLDLSDDYTVDYAVPLAPRVHQYGALALASQDVDVRSNQLGVYSLGSSPAEEVYSNQMPNIVLAASETSSGLFEVYTHQYGAYALVRGKIDRRDLRAWPFTQDDHDFWVLQLGDEGTLVYDKLSQQWAQWRSPGFVYWRGNDGVQWEGWNIACDTESGKLWIIDPEGRKDEETTPIVSIVTGGISSRMRKNTPCYMAELTLSEGQPPAGVSEGDVGLTLRTSDDGGQTYLTHGTVSGEGIGEEITVRWYGLGLIPAPGKVFEITDTGYARRIDGLNVEVSE